MPRSPKSPAPAKPSPPAAGTVNFPAVFLVPRTHCPITGELIRLLEVGQERNWIGVTSLWTTRVFQTREQLVRALSHSVGMEPAFKKSEISVVRAEGEPPPSNDPAEE